MLLTTTIFLLLFEVNLAAPLDNATLPDFYASTLKATTILTTQPATFGQVDEDCSKKCRRLPDVLIIGAKKAGTRAVLEFIRLHPEVRAAGKEVHFFDRDYERGVDYYRSKMPAARKTQLIVEKTPAYLTEHLAARRIRDTLGLSVKLVLIVRNPVDRLLSDYAQAFYKVKHEAKRGVNVSSLIKPFSEYAFVGNRTKPQVNPNYASLKVGLYAEHLQRFLDNGFQLGKHIHIVNGDVLPRQPGPEMLKLQQFLGLTPLIDESNFYFDEVKGFSCVKEPIVFKDGTKLHAHRRNRRCLGPSKGGRDREHPKISLVEREALVRYYRPFNEKFFQLVNMAQQFSSWQCVNKAACIQAIVA